MSYAAVDYPAGFYVYAYLRRKDSKDGEWLAQTPYYVGKGKAGRAWQTHSPIPRPVAWKNILVLADSLTEQDAHLLEKHLILKLGRTNVGTGCLRNFTDGGEGQSGRTLSLSTRARLRERFLGDKSSFYGKPAWNRGIPGPNLGRTTSPETIEKIKLSRRGLKMVNASSPYHGVHWLKNKKRWRAYVNYQGKFKPLGTSADPVVCAKLFDLFVKQNNLDKPLNFPT